jgi:hypothetical protein
MPLLINVGLNRKASKDFQSVGVSLNMTAELDQGLLSDPPRLQSEVQRIYSLAEDALERQISTMSAEPAPKQDALAKATTTGVPMAAGQPQLGHANGGNHVNGHANGHSNGHGGHATNGSAYGGMIRRATESQVRALRSIAKRNRLDLDHEVFQEFGVEGADQLDVKQASALIDLLKDRVQAAPAAPGGRRWRP